MLWVKEIGHADLLGASFWFSPALRGYVSVVYLERRAVWEMICSTPVA